MDTKNSFWLKKGIHDGIPIALGYLSVGFTLGITARHAGLTPFQATITSLFMNASAGEFAGFTKMCIRDRPRLGFFYPTLAFLHKKNYNVS